MFFDVPRAIRAIQIIGESLSPSKPPPKPALPEPPTRPEVYPVDKDDVLVIRSVDMHMKDNGSEHHTSHYELMTRSNNPHLVVRRGQPFKVTVNFNRAYSEETDALTFNFKLLGLEEVTYGRKTLVSTHMSAKESPNKTEWEAVLQKSSENSITVNFTTPFNCFVGVWKMAFDTHRVNTFKALSYQPKPNVYVIFNAWCEKDPVFLGEIGQRKEYITMDTGMIYTGSYDDIESVPWNYGQFGKEVLDCTLYLIRDIAKVPSSRWNDPVLISRALSAAVNANDDNGILVGNWSGDYRGGVPPSHWGGSLEIIQRFYRDKTPVKYGQCWVFAGLLTAVCRAVGLPARTITNFHSAHDSNGSMTIDHFTDAHGNKVNGLPDDSVWNFHSWNEVWMKRPDLQGDYDGWNVIDATPQERSYNIFQCGPSSKKAVLRGDVLTPYDTLFVYAEVNADEVFWRYMGQSHPLKLMKSDTTEIGYQISTKAVGEWTREDITDTYKPHEGTREERLYYVKALRQANSEYSRMYIEARGFNDVLFKFKMFKVLYGSPFSVAVAVSNVSDVTHHVEVQLHLITINYTGKANKTIKTKQWNIELKNKSEEELKFDVSYPDYKGKSVDHGSFKVICKGHVAENGYEHLSEGVFRLENPELKITIEGSPVMGQPCTITASVTNPLPVALRNGQFVFEGPIFESPLKVKMSSDVPPKADAKVTFSLKPKSYGKRAITAKFICDDLETISGMIVFIVKKSP